MPGFDHAQEEKQPQPVEGVVDTADLGNAAAEQQAAELGGKDAKDGDSQTQQADEAKEEERKKAAKASWEKLLGEKIGGKAFEAILENVSYEDLLGYAKDGSAALGDAVAGFFKDADKKNPSGVADPGKMADALGKIVQAQVDKWLETPTGKKVFTAISEWVQEHPKAVTAIIGSAVIGAAIAVWVTNMDIPELKKTFKLGKGFEAGGAIDFGNIQDMTLKAAQITIGYSSDGLKASITASHDKEKGNEVKAKVEGHGEVGETKLDGTAEVKIRDDGRTEVAVDGGVETVLAGMPASAKGKLVHGEGGDKDDEFKIEGQLSMGEKGSAQTLKGTYDPTSGAFTFNMDRKFLDGKGTVSSGVSTDKEGKTTTTQGVSYQDGDQKFGFSQSTNDAGTSNTVSASDKNVGGSGVSYDAKYTQKPGDDQFKLGLGYSRDKFKSQLDFEMKDGMSSIGGSASTTLDDNLSLSGNMRYSLTNDRLEAFGAKLGWHDPKEFKSFALEYKGKWLQDNSGYEHHFDTMFENSIGNLSGRVKAGVTLQGSDVKGANVDVLGAYRLNDTHSVLAGGGYQYDPSNPNGANQPYVQGGWQFNKQGVAVIGKWAPSAGGGNQFSIGLTIPLGR